MRYFALRVGDPQTALDLTSETLASVYEQRHSFRGSTPAEASAWIWQIARAKHARFWRQRGVDRRAMQRLGLPRQWATDEDIERTEELLRVEAARGAVRAALADLPADQQKVIQLRYVDELSDQDIAGRLAVSPEVVRARASRGLRRLRKDQKLNAALAEDDD